MRFIVRWCPVLLLLVACTKEQVHIERTESSFVLTQWLMDNCQYSVAEPTTGTIVFNAAEVKLNNAVVDQRGVFYVQSNQQDYPTLKEISSTGYSRDIQLGSSISNCPNYSTTSAKVTLKITAGTKQISLNDFPIAILEQQSVSGVNWSVNAPQTIEMSFVGRN